MKINSTSKLRHRSSRIVATFALMIAGSIATELMAANQPELRYPITLNQSSATHLVEAARAISPGTNVDSVKARLGEATTDDQMIAKRGEFRFRLLRYYIRKASRLVIEKTDRYVSFYFDPEMSGLTFE